MSEMEYAAMGKPREAALRSMARWKKSPEYRAQLRAKIDVARQLGDFEALPRLQLDLAEAEVLGG